MPSTNGHNDWSKVKKEGGSFGLSLSGNGFVASLYDEIFPLFSYNGNSSFIRKEFVEKYDLCSIGLSPKQIRIPKDCTKEEIEKCFGPIVNKNGYRYTECSNLEFIATIEKLWMIVHQKPHVLALRTISFGMARSIICEQKGMKLNWATYAEWTNAKQFWQMKVKGSICEDGFEDFFDEGEHFEYEKAHA